MRSAPSLPLFFLPVAVTFGVLASSSIAATNTISIQQPLRGNQTIVSGHGKFELGLFSTGNSGRFYLGIWYKNVPGQTVIWVGNRNSPVSDPSFVELRISADDGNLNIVALGGASSVVVWSSHMSSRSSSSSSRSNTAVLLDNGNLVLVDGALQENSSLLWQSFDHPADTLVPGAWLGENKITGEYQTLTSWRNAEDPAVGVFSDTVGHNGSSEFFYMWNQSKVYWRSGEWTGQVFARLPEMRMNTLFNMTYVETAVYRRVTSVLYSNATITRMVLDLTGQTKQYLWVDSSQSWALFWTAPDVQCDVYSLCGAFGVCDQRSLPSCRCAPGFEPASQRDWSLSDWSTGCTRKVPLQCGRNGSKDGFLELPTMKLPDGSQALYARNKSECESACSANCSCRAYAFSGGGGCVVWHDDLRNLQQMYTNAGSSVMSLYLRLAKSELQDLGRGRKTASPWAIVGICLASLAAVGIALLAWAVYRRRSARMGKEKGSMVVFSYAELRAATKNFSEKLGGGGFGSVYKGVLKGSTRVAVKKLEGLRQGDKQFRAEVNTLGLIQHVNLVRLIGFCSAGDKKLLVYEFMPNGSLDSYLFRSNSYLSWRDRYGIMLGIARALVYLHEGCRECIIHCDVKPENVLLDQDLCPKIADFGMAKLVGRDFSRVLTTMRGTVGYLAPEWISGLPISAKADVYSFGMVLLELISGRRNAGSSHDDGDRGFFPVWAAKRVAEGDVLGLADERLRGDMSAEELARACKVACWCIQDEEAQRPSMAQVVQVLEGVADVHVPPVPRALQSLAALT